jgi:hypothetical protein
MVDKTNSMFKILPASTLLGLFCAYFSTRYYNVQDSEVSQTTIFIGGVVGFIGDMPESCG